MVGIRGRSIAVVASFVALALAGPVAGAATDSERAMWVWESPDRGIVDFAVEKGVTTVYLSAPPGFSSDASFDGFLDDAHAAGLTVFAAAGDPSWAKKPVPMYSWVAEVMAHGRFDGLIVDVEPYLHPDWNHDRKRSRLITNYLRGLNEAADRAGSAPFWAAVPFWFDDPSLDTKAQPLVGAVLDRVDGIVVMAYRDHAAGEDGIIEHASTEVSLASSKGLKAVIGVETGVTTLDKTTFAEEGEAAMERALAETSMALGGEAGFGGVAIHHYGAWQSFSP